MDWKEHGERAYPPSAYVDGWEENEESRTAPGEGDSGKCTTVVTSDSEPANLNAVGDGSGCEPSPTSTVTNNSDDVLALQNGLVLVQVHSHTAGNADSSGVVANGSVHVSVGGNSA